MKEKILDYCCRGCNVSKTCFVLQANKNNPCEARQILSDMLDELIDSVLVEINQCNKDKNETSK